MLMPKHTQTDLPTGMLINDAVSNPTSWCKKAKSKLGDRDMGSLSPAAAQEVGVLGREHGSLLHSCGMWVTVSSQAAHVTCLCDWLRTFGLFAAACYLLEDNAMKDLQRVLTQYAAAPVCVSAGEGTRRGH